MKPSLTLPIAMLAMLAFFGCLAVDDDDPEIGSNTAELIVAVSGAIVVNQPPPADVSLNMTQSNVDIVAFRETQCIQLMNPITTDQGVIAAGTFVDCYFLHTDPVTNAILQGRIRFDQFILGVISASADLDTSGVECEHPLVTYPVPGNEANRGLEPGQATDWYLIGAGGFGLELHVDVPLFSDQVRVITHCG